MLLPLTETRHIQTLVHEGKMLIVATVWGGRSCELHYTVKQDGFEDSALRPDSIGWESFRKLDLPSEPDDASVVADEAENLTDKQGQYLLRSRYDTAMLTADAPVQLVSHDGMVCIFRQSTDGTLLLDRFVLDGMSNTLARRLEVRFKRSRQRLKPFKPAKISGNGQMESIDSVDFRDIDGKPFYEPSTEVLPGILAGLSNGNFAAVVTPTEEKGTYRWHVFAVLAGKLTLVSLRSGEDQAFDVSDQWFRELDPDTDQARYKSVPGIIKREFVLAAAAGGNAPVITQGLSAARYDVQRAARNGSGPEVLMRDASKLMLAVPTDQGIAVVDFAIALDGTLAELVAPVRIALREERREVPLPITVLDRIKAWGAGRSAPGGTITGLQRSEGEKTADRVQVHTADPLDGLSVGDTVTLEDTRGYDGLYRVDGQGSAHPNHFEVKASLGPAGMGSWEKVQDDTGLVSDGLLIGYHRSADDKLGLTALNHGLAADQPVQIEGSVDHNGEYLVVDKGEGFFTIERPWVNGEAVNLSARQKRRRGIVFNGGKDHLSAPFADPVRCTGGFTLEAWVKRGNGDQQTLLHLACHDPDRDRLQRRLAGQSEQDITRALLSSQPLSGITLRIEDGRLVVSHAPTYQLLAEGMLQEVQALQYIADYPDVKPGPGDDWAPARTHYQEHGRSGQRVVRVDTADVSVNAPSASTWAHVAAVYTPPSEVSAAVFAGGTFTLPTMNVDYSQGFTFEASLRLDTLDHFSTLIDFRNAGDADRIFLQLDGPEKVIWFRINNFRGDQFFLGSHVASMRAGVWMRLAIVIDPPRGGALYLDGVQIGRNKWLVLPRSIERSMNVFGSGRVGEGMPLRGCMRDVRLWNCVRSVEQIQQGSNRRLNGNEAGLVGAWLFETLDNKTSPDKTGRYPATANGAVQFGRLAQISLFVDGLHAGTGWIAPVKLDARALVVGARATTTTAEGVTSGICQSLSGEMSEVRLWTVARTAGEIKDSMHLALTGRETGLAGYWPLVGIAEEAGDRLVYDFAASASHARVLGVPYAAGVVLPRRLGDDSTLALRYRDDELFAAVEGALYEERLEFRLSPAINPLDVDGNQGWVFVPDLWGRHDRASAQTIAIELEGQPVLLPLEDNWYALQCQFIVPEGVRLVRCFGLKDVKGDDWHDVTIRRHRITLLSDTVHRSESVETLKLGKLELSPAAAAQRLGKIRDRQVQESRLLTQSAWLTREIAALTELSQSTTKTANARKDEFDRAKEAYQAAQAAYDAAVKDNANYWFRIRNLHSDLCLDTSGSDDRIVQKKEKERDADSQLWSRSVVETNQATVYYKFFCRGKAYRKATGDGGSEQSFKCLTAKGAWKNHGDPIDTHDDGTAWNQQWALMHPRKSNDIDYFSIGPRHSDKVMDVWFWSRDEGAVVNQGNSYPDNANQKFCMVPSNVLTDAGDAKVKAAKAVLDGAEAVYRTAESRYKELELTPNQLAEKISRYGTEKTRVESVLADVRSKIASDTTGHLQAAKTSGTARLDMLRLADQHPADARYPAELAVKAALLTGETASTRVQAMESCAGVLALAYQDERGFVRQARYDTTYDADGKGEQWLAGRLSVGLQRRGQALSLPSTVLQEVSTQLTIEFWAKAEMAPSDAEDWEHLAFDGEVMTLYEDTTVRYGVYKTWVSKSLAKGQYSGFKNGAVFGPDPAPKSPKSCQRRVKGVVMSASANRQTVLRIQLPDESGRIVWMAGQLGTKTDCIAGKVPDTPGLDDWTHWAFVKDGNKGEMRVYANGRLVCANKAEPQKSETQLTQPVVGIDQIALQTSWRGAITELRIWNEALGEREIEVNSQSAPSGNEPGLAAYYRLDEADGDIARDRTGRHADLSGLAGLWTPCTLGLNPSGVMNFDGVSDYLQLPTIAADFSRGCSVEAWIWLDELKPWMRIVDLGADGNQSYIILTTSEDKTSLRFYVFDKEKDRSVKSTRAPLVEKKWIHVAATIDKDGNVAMYADGQDIGSSGKLQAVGSEERNSNFIGKSHVDRDPFFKGRMHGVRLWNRVLTQREIQAGMHAPAKGDEPGLVNAWLTPVIPPGSPVMVSEYARTRVTAEGRKTAMMMRSIAMPSRTGVLLFDEQRIEELEMRWIGNAQIDPTLMGYIEGAPPVPSENLTIEDDYNGATAVELIESSEVSYSWTREQDVSGGANIELFAGVESESFVGMGIGITTSVEGVHAGFKGNLEFAYHWQNASTVSSSHSMAQIDRLELRGSKEEDAKFPHLGSRFIPKNVGYALVVSGIADVYISRLRRSGRMVGYQVLPTEGVPLDINTITFMMNPAYTMAGSLDGMTGGAATSSRFFAHVPEMRNQYGALYPASYLRLTEAYRLKDRIEKQDAAHRSYFENFNSRLVDEAALERQVDDASHDGERVTPGSAADYTDQTSPEVATLDTKIKELDGKIKALEDKTSKTDAETLQLVQYRDEVKAKQEERRKLVAAEQDRRMNDSKDRQAKIKDRHTDLSAKAHASASFTKWQTKMENLRIRAGKRNIVNTYVWDGDGGFRAEEQQFADTVEHSVGGSFDFAAALGYEGEFDVAKAAVALTAQATVGLTQTMNKTEARGSALELHVDLSGVESRGITDYKDRPLLPGEKVDRYRFMTFYLEKDTSHWHDFFNQVVDPEWLASNDEEARALRQTQMAAPNEVWRVLHRVTYVERPALMGFGRDVRALTARAEEDQTFTTLMELRQANKKLEEKMDSILRILNRNS